MCAFADIEVLLELIDLSLICAGALKESEATRVLGETWVGSFSYWPSPCVNARHVFHNIPHESIEWSRRYLKLFKSALTKAVEISTISFIAY